MRLFDAFFNSAFIDRSYRLESETSPPKIYPIFKVRHDSNRSYDKVNGFCQFL